MSLDFTTRYTFWNMMFRGINYGIACYGCNQVEIQRLLSVNGCKRAKRLGNSIPITYVFITILLLYLGIKLNLLSFQCKVSENIKYLNLFLSIKQISLW